jgi:uncharacterized protein
VFAGVVAALRGDEPPALDHYAPARISHPEHSSGTYRFCTNFAVTGRGLSPGHFIEPLEELGDSVLVVGDSRTLKVHLHTDDPELATEIFASAGEVSRLDVADMQLQVQERDKRLTGPPPANGVQPAPGSYGHAPQGENGTTPSANGRTGTPPDGAREAPRARCGALAVVSGAGLAEMFRELGVQTLDGGPTLNPSTYDLLAAIHEVPAEEVVVLPNGANVIMAAEHAAQLSDKEVSVVPTTSQQAGLAAAVALAPDRSVEENAQALRVALTRVRTGAVAPAARDDAQGRFARGDAVGFIQDEVLAWGAPGDTLRSILQALAAGDGETGEPELISVLAGEDAPLGLGDIEGMVNGGVELELRQGGQPAYWWLLAAE